MGPVIIDDTTLRDGAQTPGVAFSLADKLEIARRLDAIGVEEIEAGIPVMGDDEQEAFRALTDLGLKARLLAWNRAVISDIRASLDAGATSVEISLPLSEIQISSKLGKTPPWVIDQLRRVLDFCATKNLYVSVGGEDASRAPLDFVIAYAKAAKEHGAARFRYCDTVGILDPFSTYDAVKSLIAESGLAVEIHTHNDFGLAGANALAAVKAGATHINTTVIGLGERAGNAPLEEIIMALRYVYQQPVTYNTADLRSLAQYVAAASGRTIEPHRPVIGELMFTHESGIHADGVLKNPANYEPFPPEVLGMQRHIVVGSHSGTQGVIHRLHQRGVVADRHSVNGIMPQIRRLANERKRALSDDELCEIYEASL